MGKSSVRVVFNHYDEIADKLHRATVEIVKAAAFNVEHRAKELAKIKTGYFKNAYYTITSDHDGEGEAHAAAASRNPKATWIDGHDTPERDTQAIVVNGANYALPLEYGTLHMGAQPSLTPAVEAERPDWERALQTLEERLK